MRRAILIFVTLLAGGGCREAFNGVGDDIIIAQVETKTLRISEIHDAMPKGFTDADSLIYIERYTTKWIHNSVKLLAAEKMFASSSHDIEQMVEKYRASLMVRKLERDYINKNYIVPQLDNQIESYYNEHGQNFKLNVTLVKGRIVTLPKEFKQTKELLKDMEQADKKGTDFRSICEKNGVDLIELNTSWMEYADFLNRLPIIRQGENLEYLSKKGEIQQLEDEDNKYYFQITHVMNVGQQEPLERVEDKIRYILNNKNQSEFLNLYEQKLMREAYDRGAIRRVDIKDKDE